MRHVEIEFSTRARTVKSARDELRARCKKSPSFLRLLRKAAAEQLKGNRPELSASNPAAQRGLEYAVCKLRQQTEIHVPEGIAARPAYLMREETEHGRSWTEVSKRRAVFAMKQTTPDTLAVSKVWVYSPTISHRAARKLDRWTAPETVKLEEKILQWEDTRQIQSEHFRSDAGIYNNAGELVFTEYVDGEPRRYTLTEKNERVWIKKPSQQPHEPRLETWEEADAPLPLLPKVDRAAPVPARQLPAAPFYHASQVRMSKEDYAVLAAERTAYQEYRADVDADEAERLAFADLDEALSPEDLEEGMLEPWEALERYATTM